MEYEYEEVEKNLKSPDIIDNKIGYLMAQVNMYSEYNSVVATEKLSVYKECIENLEEVKKDREERFEKLGEVDK